MKWHIDPSKISITDKIVRKCTYFSNGQMHYAEYYLNSKLHNPNGPAISSWYDDGRLGYQIYYLSDLYLSKEEHTKLTK